MGLGLGIGSGVRARVRVKSCGSLQVAFVENDPSERGLLLAVPENGRRRHVALSGLGDVRVVQVTVPVPVGCAERELRLQLIPG